MDPDGPTTTERRGVGRRVLPLLGFVLAWAVVAVPSWALLFTHSSTEMVLASHDAIVHPTFDGRVRLDMGPYLPDVRSPSTGRVGVDLVVGKTTAGTAAELADGPLVVVVGSEGGGLGRLVAETCDQLVSIPMASSLESLNAGVAASVALYAVAQERATLT